MHIAVSIRMWQTIGYNHSNFKCKMCKEISLMGGHFSEVGTNTIFVVMVMPVHKRYGVVMLMA